MHPILFTLGPLTIYTYGVMMVAAFLAGTWLAAHAAEALPAQVRAISAEQMLDFTSIGLLVGLAGGRVLYILLQWRFFLDAPLEVFALWHGGLVWYGGFLGGMLGAWLYTRAHRLSYLRVMDQFIPFLALGHAVGRVGCFLNGGCYGKPTTAWCEVVFPGQMKAVLPTQLFESSGLFFLYIALRLLQRPSVLQAPGRVLGAYLMGYASLRFVLEYTRGDQAIWWMGLMLAQLMSVVGGLIGIGLVLRPGLPLTRPGAGAGRHARV